MSSADCPPPIEQAPMLSRPPSSPAIAILKPPPSTPTRLAAGTRTPSRITWRVGCARHPIFFSFAPKARPGASFSTMKAETPAAPPSPVRAITR